jgi:hypothetical protein
MLSRLMKVALVVVCAQPFGLKAEFGCNTGAVIAICNGNACLACVCMNCQEMSQEKAEEACMVMYMVPC